MLLIGAGGIAIVVIEVLNASGKNVDYCIDHKIEAQELLGVPVVASIEAGNIDRSEHELIVCIGNCDYRKTLVDLNAGLFGRAIHPRAEVSPSAAVGEGTVVFHGSIVQAQASLGKHVIVNTGANVDHHTDVGDFVHIGPHSTLCGFVKIEDGADIGAGVTVIPGTTIGAGAIIGAGAVVTEDVPTNSVCVGVPAKVIKYRDKGN